MIIEKKILGTVAYCGRVSTPEEFTWSWGQLIAYNKEFLETPGQTRIHLGRGNRSGQDFTRNYLAESMLGDWLFMVDTDHSFEPDILFRMLRVFNHPGFCADVLTAVYQFKGPPYQPIIYQWFEDVERYRYIIGSGVQHPLECHKIDATGCGSLLIRRNVFETIRDRLGEKPFDRIPPWGEDFAFFNRLRKLGFVSMCCPDIQSYHLRMVETTMDDFDHSALQFMMKTQVDGVVPFNVKDALDNANS